MFFSKRFPGLWLSFRKILNALLKDEAIHIEQWRFKAHQFIRVVELPLWLEIQYRYLLFIRRRTRADGDGVCARFGIRVLEFVTRCKRRAALGTTTAGVPSPQLYRDSRRSNAGVEGGECRIPDCHFPPSR